MKKFGITLLILFFILAAFYAVLQSTFAKDFIRRQIDQSLADSPYKIKIEHIEGAIPNRIELKGVEVTGDDVAIKIKHLTLRPILWRLLRKELAFKNVIAEKVSISDAKPFDYTGRVQVSQERFYLKGYLDDIQVALRYNLKKNNANFSVRYHSLRVKGRAVFTEDHEFSRANIQFSDPEILRKLPFDAFGRIFANVQVTKEDEAYVGKALWQIPDYKVGDKSVGSIKGEGDFTFKDDMLSGQITGIFAKIDFNVKTLPNFLFDGLVNVNIENLQSLYIPDFFGKVEAKINLTAPENVQTILIEPIFTKFSYQTYSLENLTGSVELIDPFNGLKGPATINVLNASWNDLKVTELQLKTEMSETSWPFSLSATGNTRHAFEITTVGSWEKPTLFIQILAGNYYNMPFLLEAPTEIIITRDEFLIPKSEISMNDGLITVYLDRRGPVTDGFINADSLPLDIFSYNPLEPNLGTAYLEIKIRERKKRLTGSFSASFDQIEPVVAAGKITGDFSENTLKLKADFNSREKPLLELDVTLPIHLSIWPFDAKVLYSKDAKGHVAFDGRAEEFLDFLDLSSHHLEGDLKADLSFKNSLARPLASGSIVLENGSYENYYTGTNLGRVQARFLAEKNTLYLQELTAVDPNGGEVQLEGQIDLLANDNYPFRLDSVFSNFQFVQIDLVNATANGDLHIKGNTLSATLTGDVLVNEALLTIPGHIPRNLPELKVTYRHPIRQILEQEPQYKPYPLLLDLSVSAPKVKIEGRGLDSEWRGDFDLGGTFTSIATQGKLELTQGQFNLSSRKFKLTEGALSFSGKEHQMPHLNLAGTVETKGILITAQLNGPLDNPQVHLQSNPPLPLSSIMSYLLFGQDISEIGGFQALQIVTSLASLAGTGPDIMESTRKSLGVDRLRVISDPDAKGGEGVALEVGKYVSDGVLVSFSQGTEEASTNVSVEIELKNNFVFEIQSDQRQEQGKFTLKWNLNY